MALVTVHSKRQRGQALVFVTVTILLMVIAMMMTYNVGQLSNQKTRLQNTADAAAYSAAVAQARGYNFSAYMNRAMIANDVAVAQMVALRSWTENYHETFKPGGLVAKTNPGASSPSGFVQAGPMHAMWTVQERVARTAAQALQRVFPRAAPEVVRLLQGMNTGLAVTQKVYHFSTALTVAQILGVDDRFNDYMRSMAGFDLSAITSLIRFSTADNVVRSNDANAALSLLGFAAYAHGTSNWLNFTADRNPVGPWGTDTSDESYSYTRSWCALRIIVCIIRKRETVHVRDIRSRTYPDDGSFDGPRKDRYANVVIGSLDEFTVDRNKAWNLPLLVDPVLLIGPAGRPPSWFLKMLFHDSEGVALWNDDRLNSRAGAGKGFRKPGSWNNRWKAHDETSFLGLATIPICGIPFWGCINIPTTPFKSGWNFDNAEASVSTGNSSGHPIHLSRDEIFRTYRDVRDIAQGTATAHQNWRSPPILVEIERPAGSIPTTQVAAPGGCSGRRIKGATVNAVFSPGNFNLGNGASANCMRAMSKAEAYFSRPTDLWPRADGKTEYGSLYSPYWQPRLARTTTEEQTLSLITHYCDDQGGVAACAGRLMRDFGVSGSAFATAVSAALR